MDRSAEATSWWNRENAFSQNSGLLRTMRWVAGFAWATDPGLSVAISAVSLVRSLVPALLAIIVRSIVNATADAMSGKTVEPHRLVWWLCLGFAATAAAVILDAVFDYLCERQKDELNIKITHDVVNHSEVLDYSLFEDPAFQDLMQRAHNNIAPVLSTFLRTLLTVVTNLGQIISLIVLLVVIEPALVLFLSPLSIPYFLFHWRFSRHRFEEQQKRATNTRQQTYYFNQMTSYQSVAEVKIYGLAPLFKMKLLAILTEFRNHNRHFQKKDLALKTLFAFISVAAVYIAFWLAILKVIAGALTLGDIAIYAGAAARLRQALDGVIASAGVLRAYALQLSNLQTYLSVKPGRIRAGNLNPGTGMGEVELRHVTFTYPGASKPALNDVSFKINPGETVALVGKNGAGKTTVAKLLANLYRPDSGTVYFDRHDLRSLDPGYAAGYVAVVLQEFGRYEATAAENIAYGDWKRLSGNLPLIRKTAEKAKIADLIEKMPRGYETLLGRSFGTYNLSGGQWQKLAIARCFARDAALLILDEPTANLDARSEYEVFLSFKDLAKGRSTLIISHRFSTVRMADRILVMEDGYVVDEGTHESLLANGGLYASLYALHARRIDHVPEREVLKA